MSQASLSIDYQPLLPVLWYCVELPTSDMVVEIMAKSDAFFLELRQAKYQCQSRAE
jgi:hypothetical protein